MNLTLGIGLSIVVGILLGLPLAYFQHMQLQNAEATGCPTNFVAEHVDNALKAYNEGDAKEVKNQLDLAKEAVAQFEEEE